MNKEEIKQMKTEFGEQVDAVTNEFRGMKDDLSKLGWNVLWPLIPLIGLAFLIIHALS